MADEPTPQETPPERPEWLEDRFESVEAQARAYADAQREMSRVQTERQREQDAFASALEGFQQQQAPPPQQQYGQQQQFDPVVSAYEQAWVNGDPRAALDAQAQYTTGLTVDAVGRLLEDRLGPLGPQLEQAQAAMRESNLRLAEGLVERELGSERYAAVIPKVSAMVQEDGSLLPNLPSIEAYRDRILFLAKNAEHGMLEQRNAEYEAERAEKLGAQTLSGGYNRPQADQDYAKSEVERIKNTQTGTFEELMRKTRGA